MSTFDKDCPECEATNSAAAAQCVCGYVFNPLYLEDPRLALEQAAQEEQIIEEYLAARADQAAEIAKEAVHAVLENPESESKLLAATRAQRAARAAKAELVEQRARTAESRLRAHITNVDNTGDTKLTQSPGLGRRPWQTVVVTEALTAASVQTTGVQQEGTALARSGKQPGPAFRAAQASKAEKAVSATARKLDVLSVKAKADQDVTFVEEVEISGPVKRV